MYMVSRRGQWRKGEIQEIKQQHQEIDWIKNSKGGRGQSCLTFNPGGLGG